MFVCPPKFPSKTVSSIVASANFRRSSQGARECRTPTFRPRRIIGSRRTSTPSHQIPSPPENSLSKVAPRQVSDTTRMRPRPADALVPNSP